MDETKSSRTGPTSRTVQRQAKLLRDAGADSFETALALVEDEQQPPALRLAATWELGYGKSRPSGSDVRQAIRGLVHLCATGIQQLCMPAANAMVGIGSRQAVLPLIRLLRQAPSSTTREAAAYALGFLADQRALLPLISTLEDMSEEATVRGQAAEALGELADTLGRRPTRPVKPLIAALGDRSAEVRFWACYALSQYHDRRAIPALRKVVRDRAVVKGWWSVGREAIWAIAVLDRDRKADAIWESNRRVATRRRLNAVRQRRVQRA